MEIAILNFTPPELRSELPPDNTHQCSYYCHGNIHAIETLVRSHVTNGDIIAAQRNHGYDCIAVKDVAEYDASFIQRTLSNGPAPSDLDTWIPKLCIIRLPTQEPK